MSIYSGFGTRQQERNYNSLLEYWLGIIVANIMSTKANFVDGYLFNQSFSKKYIVHMDLWNKLEEYKYMKPHYTKALDPIIDYLISQNEFSSVPNDIESVKSKMSFFNNPSHSKMEVYENNPHTSERYQVSSNDIETMRSLYNRNSIEKSKIKTKKGKNLKNDYYGSKSRSNSRQHKNQYLSRDYKNKAMIENIIIENNANEKYAH